MNEQLLKSIIRLYVLLAGTDGLLDAEKARIEEFLSQHLSATSIGGFLNLLEETVQELEGIGKDEEWQLTEIQSICSIVNREFRLSQKYFLYLELLELSAIDGQISKGEALILTNLPKQLHLDPAEVKMLRTFALATKEKELDSKCILLISNSFELEFTTAITWHLPDLQGLVAVLKLPSIESYFVRYLGTDETLLNGRILQSTMSLVWAPGVTLRQGRLHPVFFTDIRERFSTPIDKPPISFEAKDISFRFPSGKTGLHTLNLAERGGRMIAIMGASGGGKSTLFNVLNGNEKPDTGKVLINGLDLHRQSKKLEGIIGYIPQDDLLNEHLTVFQNLYYAAKFSFAQWPEQKVVDAVVRTLSSLGLLETRDTIVGSPLRKTISGGQRKRLNIGMELIRQPSILFVDEPTSGLSSRDSMRTMELLKDLTLHGKLVFVIIHQPSPDIYKMFDKLVVLDMGGYLIYYGNGLEAIPYFRVAANLPVNQDYNALTSPDEIFDIVEAKVLNESGEELEERRLSPQDWNRIYLEKSKPNPVDVVKKPVQVVFHPPSFFKQAWLYLRRDATAKLHDSQYLLINLLEAPVLALLLAVIVRFAPIRGFAQMPYRFFQNENIPAFFFMSVIVALFMGLSVSAEEILRDRLLLKREKFLHLSRDSYLVAKILLLFLLSAFHTLSFVLISDFVLEVNEIGFEYWLALFSTACCANLMGLILSDTFKNAVTVYVLIPLLLIPQLVLGGVVIRFDRINPAFGNSSRVPLLGDVMISRWAYEAIMVAQFKNNNFQKHVFPVNQKLADYQYRRLYLLPTLSSLLQELRYADTSQKNNPDLVQKQKLLYTEFRKEAAGFNIDMTTLESIRKTIPIDQKNGEILKKHLDKFREYYNRTYKEMERELERELESPMPNSLIPDTSVLKLKQLAEISENERTNEILRNQILLERILVSPLGIVRKTDPIYQNPEPRHALDIRAHFYAPFKHFMGYLFPTETFNLVIIWLMSSFMIVALRFRWFRKIMVMKRSG